MAARRRFVAQCVLIVHDNVLRSSRVRRPQRRRRCDLKRGHLRLNDVNGQERADVIGWTDSVVVERGRQLRQTREADIDVVAVQSRVMRAQQRRRHHYYLSFNERQQSLTTCHGKQNIRQQIFNIFTAIHYISHTFQTQILSYAVNANWRT